MVIRTCAMPYSVSFHGKPASGSLTILPRGAVAQKKIETAAADRTSGDKSHRLDRDSHFRITFNRTCYIALGWPSKVVRTTTPPNPVA